MPIFCRDNHIFTGAEVINHPRYNEGFKYCAVCKLGIKTDKKRCECCGSMFRNKPKRGWLKEIVNKGKKRY